MLEIFGVSLKLVQSTSPVPGKLAASVVQVNGKVWADLFLWDPLSKVLQFDEDAFSQLLVSAKKAEGGWVSIVLSITDFVIRIVNGLRGLFGGSYGGSLGFGQVGALVATASALAFIVATVAAAVVVIPLSCMAWALRLHINAQIRREREKVAAQVFSFFETLELRLDRLETS